MSATIQNGSVVQVNLVGKYDGQVCINTFHYYATITGTGATPVMTEFLAWFDTTIWGGSPLTFECLSQFYHATVTDCRLTGQIVAGAGARSLLEVWVPTPLTGTADSGVGLPSGTAIVFKKTGQLAGRANRGRIYIFGVSIDYVVASEIANIVNTYFVLTKPLLELTKTFGAGGNTLTLTPCIAAANSVPTAAQIGLTWGINSAVRYQRRREVGVGI